MFEKKLITFIVLLAIAGFAGGIYLSSGNNVDVISEATMSSDVKVKVSDSSYDWGTIGIDDGNVEKEFEIKNEGSSDLILSSVETSCMCTTAQLIFGNESSPEFGMHSKSSYKMSVLPGETVKLKVVFDPAFHGPSGVGPINRQIKVKTNDASNPELNFMLTAMVRR